MIHNKFFIRIKRKALIILIIGIILTSYGIIRYFFLNPEYGVNLLTQLPTMIDGSISLITGILLLFSGIHLMINKTRFAKEMEIEEIEKRKEARKSPKWLKHY